MKFLVLLGGALGFGIGLVSSVMQQTSWPVSLLRASLAAYAGSWLLIWWGKSWQRNFHLARIEKEKQAVPAPATAPAPVRATLLKPSKA